MKGYERKVEILVFYDCREKWKVLNILWRNITAPKRAKSTLSIGNKYENIPIVSESKYFGLITDQKLTGDSHLRKLFHEKRSRHQGKFEFITNNSCPIIKGYFIWLQSQPLGKSSFRLYLYLLLFLNISRGYVQGTHGEKA